MIKVIIIILSTIGLIPSISCANFICKESKTICCGGLLEEAVYLSHAACLQDLLQYRIIRGKLNIPFYQGFHEKHKITLLQFALWFAQAKIIPILLAHGADPHYIDNSGWDCFHFAAFSIIESDKKVEFLLKTGADCTRKTKTQITALEIALSWNNITSATLIALHSITRENTEK